MIQPRRAGAGLLLAGLLLAGAVPPLPADQVRVAVAANFTATMRALASAFQGATGHTVVLSSGSTGKLYAQILHGAPFALFLAADQDRPARLEAAGRASDRFTYALGRLVLWSPHPDRVDPRGEVLTRGRFRHLAIANPGTAPYGAAALQVLEHLGLASTLEARLVRGESIAQAYQFVATGNAELGFVALAQVTPDSRGSRWLVPRALHPPIRQDAVLLPPGRDQPAARALLAYLRGPAARALIGRSGYDLEPAPGTGS
jgi:molybdate transport system substrate-binding protein